MHSARARIRALAGALLLAGFSMNPIITFPANNDAHEYDHIGESGEIGHEYFNVCVEIVPPFVVHERRGADIILINVLISRLARAAASERLRGRVIAMDLDASARIGHCDIMLPNVWNNASTPARVLRQLIGSDFYNVENMMICATKRRNADDWRKLRTITATQLAMAMPFVLYVAITYYIAGKLIRADKFQNLDVMLWSYFRVLCSVPNGAHHQPTQRALRFLYTGWLIFCFILTINYNTLVLRVFKSELYTPQIRSYGQALRENVDLHTLAAFRGSMAYPRVFDCRSVRRCLGLLKAADNGPNQRTPSSREAYHKHSRRRSASRAHGGKLMVALPETILDYHRNDFLVSGELTIHCFEHPHAVYKRQMFVRPAYRGANNNITGHWKVAALNKLLFHLRRSGVYTHWIKRFTRTGLQLQRNFHRNDNRRHRPEDGIRSGAGGRDKTLARKVKSPARNPFNDNPDADDVDAPRHAIGMLGYKDFIVLYAYLLIGVVISTVGFVGEHVYYYLKHNRRYSLAR